MKTPVIALAAAIGAMLIAQPVLAEAVTVQYKDLDLATEAGQKQLDSRIESAARKVCGLNDMRTGTRIPDKDAYACVADAKKKIEQRVATLTSKDKEVAGS